MKVVILMENTACRADIACAHGLSMYIETDRHKLLFDMGPDARFIDNARTLGVDLTAVDTAFLSHAHNDHCGGLEAFLKLNEKAKVYMQKAVWGQYYVVTPQKREFIGMDAALKNYENRFVLCEGVQKIDDELTVFSAVPGRELWSGANDTLREKLGADYPRDTFRHEQNLLVTEGGKTALFAGCAHCGIVNILKSAEDALGRAPDAVFAGFHLCNPSLGRSEPNELVDAVGERLREGGTARYFTGHCTGAEAYARLKRRLGARLGEMSAGSAFTI
jgi:7,8-dihydropterin-6-yl-methyl-4-(beta-D-ribofuranosyl)aminobenzene 5'-phosphate synthase